MLVKYDLVTFTWGNVSGVDRETGVSTIKPSGVAYDDLRPEGMVVLNFEGEIVSGALNPSSDAKTHLELYKASLTASGIVHTHSPYAVVWAQTGLDISCYGTTHADYSYGAIPCARELTQAEIDGGYEKNTGVVIIEIFRGRNLDPGQMPGATCQSHGPSAWGRDAADVVYHAVVMEEVAKMAILTRETHHSAQPALQWIQDKHYQRKHGSSAYYGQRGWVIPVTDTYRLGLYEKSTLNRLTLREKLAVTRQTGFDYMKPSVDESDEKLVRFDWTPGEVKRLADAVYELGVPIHSICLSGHRRFPMGHPDKEIRRQSVEIMEKAVILISRLSIRVMQLAGYDVYYEPGDENTRRWSEDNLEKAVLMTVKCGVAPVFETMETPPMNTAGKAMRKVACISNPWLQIYPDIGNLTCAAKAQDGSVEADMKLRYGYLSAVHLKKTRPGEFRKVPYECGHVDFTGYACAVMRLGVRVSVGEFWYTGGTVWQSDISDVNIFLRRKLDEAAKLCNIWNP